PNAPARRLGFVLGRHGCCPSSTPCGGMGVTKPVVVDVDDERWAKRLRLARERLQWSTAEWGPAPGILGSRVPQNLIQPGDGQGWSEWKSEAA
ncbi:hypothetical protein CWC17_19260, partial [Pseudoalteromonas sp. S3785]